MTCPGTPTTTELDGTGLTTTALAPIRLSSPILIGAEDLGSGADGHAVADGGMAFPGIGAAAAEGDAVVHRDVVAHLRGFSDHHAGRVVDEQAGAEDAPGWMSTPVRMRVSSANVRAANLAPRFHSQWLIR